MKKQGPDWVGLCPFHNENTPSFFVSNTKGVYHCFGCGASGDVIRFEMAHEKKDFRTALASLDGSPLVDSVKKPNTPSNSIPAPTPSSEKEALELLDHYHQTLINSPNALAYLKKRGLHHPGLVAHFKIGYVDRTAAKLLGRSPKHSKDPKREELRAWGFLRENGFEHFAGCLTLPIFQADGSLGEVYGRRTNRTKPNVSPHLYLPGSHKGVFNLAALHNQEPVIVCEAIMDALTFWCHGFQNVTAAFGARGFTDEMQEAFKAKGIQSVYIAYDGDEPGHNAADELGIRLSQSGFETYRMLLPDAEDVNSFALKQTDPRGGLANLLRSAQRYLLQEPFEQVEALPTDIEILPEIPSQPLAASATQSGFSNRPLQALQTSTANQPTPPSTPPSGAQAPRPLPDHGEPLEISDVDFKWNGADQLDVSVKQRHYRVRNLENIRSLASLKVQIRLMVDGQFFLDTLDLTAHRQRQQFIVAACDELDCKPELLKKDLSKLLIGVERITEYRLAQAQKAQKQDKEVPEMSQQDQEEALAFLKQPDLLDQILRDFDVIGLVGEEDNKLVGYLAATSRKLKDPLAVLVQSSSSAGKTTLMDAILSFIPKEEQEKWTTVTQQALYYFDEDQLQHKILAVAEEEGMEKATYPLKILQSEKELKIATTVKNPTNGEFKVQTKVVFGPCAIILTTTSASVDEELINRFIRLTVNEDRSQTMAIHRRQRMARMIRGMEQNLMSESIKHKHHNAQRLLKPMRTFNPYADQLTFNSDFLRSRRDHEKYLGLIDAITFLHQAQRPHRTLEIQGQVVDYVEVSLDDIRHANRLTIAVLGRCLDELAPQTRRLLKLIRDMVESLKKETGLDQEEIHFTRKRVREYTKWSDYQLKIHMKRLEELEYLLAHQGGRGQLYVYELVWHGEGEDGERFVPGVVDPDQLTPPTSGVKRR